ncbi:MAG: hypothetical protein Crog4KO_24100 [Crocinitomicaceae bacterium]
MEEIRQIIRECLLEITEAKKEHQPDWERMYYYAELQRTAYEMAMSRIDMILRKSSLSNVDELKKIADIVYNAPGEDMDKLKKKAKAGKSIFEM